MKKENFNKKLTFEQYNSLKEKGTEKLFSGHLLKEKREGIYNCVACENPLFLSNEKFDSGTGWPSFYRAISGSINYIKDINHGMSRTEIVCSKCGSHLGYIFEDDPLNTKKHCCVNSICLDFNLEKS